MLCSFHRLLPEGYVSDFRRFICICVHNVYMTSDSDWPQLRGLAIFALRGALKFFAVLNVLGEDFMVFWREHDELFNRFPEEFKSSKSFPSDPFY